MRVVRKSTTSVSVQSQTELQEKEKVFHLSVTVALHRSKHSGRRARMALVVHVAPSQRLMAGTMASQPFLVPNTSCAGRRCDVMSSETAASGAFAARR